MEQPCSEQERPEQERPEQERPGPQRPGPQRTGPQRTGPQRTGQPPSEQCGGGPVVIRLDASSFGDDPSERLRDALRAAEAAPREVVCDVGELARPDMATLEILLRMQLTARRLGHEIRLYRPNAELVQLLELIGMADTLPLYGS
ncbi:STAS domain-containing protein [Actinomadura terrae]|uniref:STAS domain-containing protein n=1 Tax=Actinomadura terrae TaxID=604353 RepID=UPI001FA71DBB|nr:STAS domain-containing protein [Actinomadura terrae]